MQIRILGSGTSTGVPVPACRCPVCLSGKERNQRTRTSALLQDSDGRSLLIDSATDFRFQALRWDIRRIDAVLYTHSHSDHILGIEDLKAFNFTQNKRIPCYGTTVTLEEIKNVFGYIFTPEPSYEGGFLPQLDLVPLEAGKPVVVQEIEVLPFQLWHGSMPVLGYRVGDMAYATDCSRIPDESLELLKGIKLLFLDGLRYAPPHITHFTIPEAIAMAQKIGAEKTYLTHTTHTVDYDEVSAMLPEGIMLAYDGLLEEFNAR